MWFEYSETEFPGEEKPAKKKVVVHFVNGESVTVCCDSWEVYNSKSNTVVFFVGVDKEIDVNYDNVTYIVEV